MLETRKIKNITGYVYFGFADPTAKSDATAYANTYQPFAPPSNTLNDIRDYPTPYAAGEYGHRILDGKVRAFPDDTSNVHWGWWSKALSDKDGYFEVNPLITYAFANAHKSIGLTIDFADAPPQEVEIVMSYKGAERVRKTFQPTELRQVFGITSDEYDRIDVIINKCLPESYAKIQEITFGVEYKYDGKTYIEWQVLEEFDPIGAEVTANEMRITLRNENGDFNMFDPQSDAIFLMRNQQLECAVDVEYEDGEIVTCPMGTFFLEDWKEEQKGTISFTAYDKIYSMNGAYRKSKVYTNERAENIFLDLFDDIGLYDSYGAPLFNISDEVKNLVLSGFVPIMTWREALAYIAFASGAHVMVDRGGILQVFKMNISQEVKKEIARNEASTPKSQLLSERNAVTVTQTQMKIKDERETLFEGELSGDIVVDYKTCPATNITVTGTNTGHTAYANAVEIRGAKGNITVTGNTYDVYENEVMLDNASSGEILVTELPQNSLITTSDDVQRIADWILPFIMLRTTQAFQWLFDFRLSVGDKIKLFNSYDSTSDVFLTKNTIKVNSGVQVESEVLG